MSALANARWVVTGAAGTIGVALRQALAERGVELVSTDIVPVTPVAGARDDVASIELADLESLTRLFDGADGVVHLGGLSDEADFHLLAEVNVVGTYHVLEAARRSGLSRVVYASSNRATGMYSTATFVDPAMPPRPDGFYGVSKVAGEALCRLYADKFGLSTIAMRIGSYEREPHDARELSTWLSHPDAIRAFIAAMTTKEHHATFYAVSANARGWWDRSAGERIGYLPEDDAGTSSRLGEPREPQGGRYALPSSSLDLMRE